MGESGPRPPAPDIVSKMPTVEQVHYMDPKLVALAWVNFIKRAKNINWLDSRNFKAMISELNRNADAKAGDNVDALLGDVDVEQSVAELKTYLTSYEHKSKDKLLNEIELLSKTFEREYRAVIDTMDAADLSSREREQCLDFLQSAKSVVEAANGLNLSERIMYLNRAIAEVERARQVIVSIVSKTK